MNAKVCPNIQVAQSRFPDLPQAPQSFNRWDYALAGFGDFLRLGTTHRYSEKHGVVDDPCAEKSVVPGKIIISEKPDENDYPNCQNAITVLNDKSGKAQLYYVEVRLLAIQDFGTMVGEYSRKIKPLDTKHFSNFRAPLNTEILKGMIDASKE